ncbi:MAG: ASKHA domain-containing protein, partial [bacterium]
MEIKVIFQPEKKIVYVLSGTSIMEAAILAGISLTNLCGDQGTCGKCVVKVIKGAFEPTVLEQKHLSSDKLKQGIRLACQSKIYQESVIFVEKEVKLYKEKILSLQRENKISFESTIKKYYFHLEKPNIETQISLFENLQTCLKNKTGKIFQPNLFLLQKLTDFLQKSDYKITVVVDNEKIIALEQNDTTNKNYGFAFDIGTTTVVGTLMNLNTGEEILTEVFLNKQTKFGANVISRINFCINQKNGLMQLHQEIINTINEIIIKIAKQTKIKKENIYEMCIVGNPCMQHLFFKISPKSLGIFPFVSVISNNFKEKSSCLKLKINKKANVYSLPNISSFVGSDIIGIIFVSEIYKKDKISLCIDIGTNGEIVLGSKHRLLSCSTAAGPAFEGGEISCGMRATQGAIEKVILEDDVIVNVIGNIEPCGICGTGLIDLVAEMLKKGILDSTGKFKTKKELQNNLSPLLLKRLDNNAFYLSSKIKITQKDIRNLQLAKAAIKAGIEVLKKILEIENEDIEQVYIAGTFGNYIRKENALKIGLIPNIDSSKIRFIGNAAQTGSKM